MATNCRFRCGKTDADSVLIMLFHKGGKDYCCPDCFSKYLEVRG